MEYYNFTQIGLLIQPYCDTTFRPQITYESIMIFLTAIYFSQLRKRIHQLEEKEIKYTHTRILKDRLIIYLTKHKYIDILNLLQTLNILEIDRSIETEYKHKKYYFKILNFNLFDTYTEKPIYHQDNINSNKKLDILKIKEFGVDYLNIIREISKHKCDISKDQFITEVKNKYKSYSDKKIEQKKTPLLEENYITELLYTYKYIQVWNSKTIKDRIMLCGVDSYGGRIHHLFTNTPSFCRKYINGIDVNIDLCQSQPTILGKVILDGLGRKTKYIDILNSNKDIYNYYVPGDMDRTTKKDIFFTDIYSPYYFKTFKNFKTIFPEEGEYLESIQKDYIFTYYDSKDIIKKTTNIPCLMQRTESEAFVGIMKELVKKGIRFVPVHDAIYCSKEDSGMVLRIMRSFLNGCIGDINFNINVEELKKIN